MKHTFFVMIAVAGVLMAQQKLEDLGVKEIQTLLGGSTEDLDRLARMVDDAIAANPKSAFPKFMHGVVVFGRSGAASKQGDLATAAKLYQASIAEMEEAVRWEPDNIGVRVPRGAVLITATRSMPAQMGKPLLESGLSDFEHVLRLQEQDGSFEKRSDHQRGELLSGLGDGWARFGKEDKAREYFQRIVKDLPGTIYQTRAQAWLDGKPEAKSPVFFTCSGCHVGK
jgi:tetratricopeptide (TPR) repeat protein